MDFDLRSTSAKSYLQKKTEEAAEARKWTLEPLRHFTYFLLGFAVWIIAAGSLFGLSAVPLKWHVGFGCGMGFFFWLNLYVVQKEMAAWRRLK